MSCVRASAFLHVFYVSCLCVVKTFFFVAVCLYVSTYVCVFASMCFSVLCVSVYVSCSLFKIWCFLYEKWAVKKSYSETLRSVVAKWRSWLPTTNDFCDTYMDSRLTPISQSITLRGRARKCYYYAVEPRKTMHRLWSYQALCIKCHVKTPIQSPFSLAINDVTLLFEWPFKIKWTNKSGLSWKNLNHLLARSV